MGGADITLRASLWLTIFVCMLIRCASEAGTWCHECADGVQVHWRRHDLGPIVAH